jgi:hypothetical protein
MTSSRIVSLAACVFLLLAMLVQMALASPAQSAAFDEGYSITYGYAYLRTGDIRLSRGQNPPLTNILMALPLLLRHDIALPLDHPTWANGDIYGFSDEFLWKANSNPHQLIQIARFPAMALAVLLACVVFAFTRSLFGARAALAALFVCAFDPNILAHGHVAGTDLGVTFFMLASVWLWVSALKRNSLRVATIAGLLGGAALASKYSAVWLVPSVLVIGLAYPTAVRIEATEADRHREENKPNRCAPTPSGSLSSPIARTLYLLLIFGIAAFFIIWVTFGLSIGPVTPGSLPIPAPDYWASLGGVRYRVESGTPAFMLGQISPTGFLLYYPFVFLAKTPLPTLLGMAIGLLALIRRRDRAAIAACVPPAWFMLAAMLNNLSLGYRLILPVLPFGLTLAGAGGHAVLAWSADFRQRNILARSGTIVAALAAVWLVADTLAIAPEHIAYFNQFAGNRDRDHDLLVDSNLDWGQGLIALREWLRANNIDTINLSYFGTAHAEAYGIRADLLPGFPLSDFGPESDGFSAYALPPGWYAISATSLQLGLLYSHWDLYAPFRTRVPDARVGRSILAYRLDYPSTGVDRAVVLGPVASDLDLETLGGQPDRQLRVKWAGRDAAVLDMQGPARYITRGGEPIVGFAPDVHDALIAHAQRLGSDASGALRLFEIDARAALGQKLASLVDAPIAAPDGTPIRLPIEFDAGLALLGYDLTVGASQPIDLVTYWQTRQTPATPLAVFVHVLGADGRILAQGDGLNVRLSSLEDGDVILQHFIIDHPAGAALIDIGIYDPTDANRMAARLPNGRIIDHVNVALSPARP